MRKFSCVLAFTLIMLFVGCGGGGGNGGESTSKSCTVNSVGSSHAEGFYDVTSTNCSFFATAKLSNGTILGYAVSTPQNPNLQQVSYGSYGDYCKVDFLVFTEAGGWHGYFTNSDCEIKDTEVYDNGDVTRCFYIYKSVNNEVACG